MLLPLGIGEYVATEWGQPGLGGVADVAVAVEASRVARQGEEALHRAQPAVVVEPPAARPRPDVRRDQHAAGIAAAGGRVLGVEQRVGLRRLGAQRDPADGPGGGDRVTGAIDELE